MKRIYWFAATFAVLIAAIIPASASAASWSTLSVPIPSGASAGELFGVSCSASTECIGVGRYTKEGSTYPLAVRWNGTAWSLQSAINPTGATNGVLKGVSCSSATACTAVGSAAGKTVAERWNGTSWTLQTTPNPAGPAVLSGVSCPTATFCQASGYFIPSAGGGYSQTLQERWNGSTWAINPAYENFYERFYGASCASATACMSVGYWATTTPEIFPLGVFWNGEYGEEEVAAIPSGQTNTQFLGTSCVSAKECFAVGGAQHGVNTQITLAERWTGSSFSLMTTPNPSGALASVLQSVSCKASSACEAVGDYVNSSGTNVLLAETWNGTTWAIQTTPAPSGATFSALFSVSCSSTTTCMAVGYYVSGGVTRPFAEKYS